MVSGHQGHGESLETCKIWSAMAIETSLRSSHIRERSITDYLDIQAKGELDEIEGREHR